ncbi:MAG: hypothetical protein LUI60_01470 [Clostridia bacterium]|nr:hypothetical protein [Clostridia bacterium]
MNKKYFRITAYNPAHDISAILDCNGCYEKLWQFSSMLVFKGFNIIAVGDEMKFADGNFGRVANNDKQVILRACAKGEPEIDGNEITVHGRTYTYKK